MTHTTATVPTQPIWVRTSELTRLLALSRNRLFELKAAGAFSPGEHYRQDGTRILLWDLQAVDQRLRERAAETDQ